MAKRGKLATVIGIAGGFGAGAVIENVISATMPAGAGLLLKGMTRLGGAVIGLMIASDAEEFTAQKVEDFELEMYKAKLAQEEKALEA